MQWSFKSLKRLVLIISAIVLIWVIVFGFWSCAGKVFPLTLGITYNETNSLILVAQDRGYFTDNGLNVTIKVYPSGKAAVDGMLNHEVDMANSSEYAFVGNIFDSKNVRMIGVINRSIGEYIVGRTDKGINDISDLKGKRIGVPLKSRPEFALGRFLYLNGIDTSEVTLVNVDVDHSAKALISGEVDAVATWQPYINQARKGLGNGVVVWSVQNDQTSYNGVICAEDWAVQHPDVIKRFLKSMVQAESYNTNNPGAVKAIVQKKLNYSDAYIESVWPDYRFSVSLDQSLILAMEDEARWMISNNLTTRKTVPDFLVYIYMDGLKAVKPEAVNIIQ